MDTWNLLQESETAVLRGGFVILFRHGHWYLIGTKESGVERQISSVHIMSPDRAQGTLAEIPSTTPKSYEELGSNFAEEVTTKVLPTASDYLPMLRSQTVSLTAGIHTDTMQQVGYTASKESALLDAIGQMFAQGKPGTCLYFSGDAL